MGSTQQYHRDVGTAEGLDNSPELRGSPSAGSMCAAPGEIVGIPRRAPSRFVYDLAGETIRAGQRAFAMR